MNYYCVNGFNIQSKNIEEAIIKADERRKGRSEMIAQHMLFQDDSDDELFSIAWLNEYDRAKLNAYIEFKDIHIDIDKLARKGNMYIDLRPIENKDYMIYNEFCIEETDEVEQYTVDYLKKNYKDTDYVERYNNPNDSSQRLIKALDELIVKEKVNKTNN